jgi:hypothetical protein
VVTWSADSSRIPLEQQIRDSLIRSLDANGATPSTFLDLLDAVTENGTWRKLHDRQGQPFATFTDFVTAERPEGLGLHDKRDLEKHLALQHKEEREPYLRAATVTRMADMRTRVRRLLGDEIPRLKLDHGGDRRSSTFQMSATHLKQDQHTAETIVARLKRDDPDEARRVISGKTTANAAARAKGWRRPRIVLSSPERVARKLRDYFTDPEQLALLVKYLQEEKQDGPDPARQE